MKRLFCAAAVLIAFLSVSLHARAELNNTAFSKNPDDYWARIAVSGDKFTISVGGKFASDSITFDQLLTFGDFWNGPATCQFPSLKTIGSCLCYQWVGSSLQKNVDCLNAAKEFYPLKIIPWTIVAADPKANLPLMKSTCEAGDDAQSFKCALPGSFDTQGKTADQITDDAIAAISNNLYFSSHRGFAFWAIDSSKALSVSPILDVPAMLKNARLADEAAAKKAEEEAAAAAASSAAAEEQQNQQTAGENVVHLRTFDEGGMCTLMPAASPNPAMFMLLASALAPMIFRRRR